MLKLKIKFSADGSFYGRLEDDHFKDVSVARVAGSLLQHPTTKKLVLSFGRQSRNFPLLTVFYHFTQQEVGSNKYYGFWGLGKNNGTVTFKPDHFPSPTTVHNIDVEASNMMHSPMGEIQLTLE